MEKSNFRITAEDQKILDALKEAIADPNTTDEERKEYREELGSIATSYVIANILGDDD